jgi:hypothetical protein
MDKQFTFESDFFNDGERCHQMLVKAYGHGEIYDIYDMTIDDWRELTDFPQNEQDRMIEMALPCE